MVTFNSEFWYKTGFKTELNPKDNDAEFGEVQV